MQRIKAVEKGGEEEPPSKRKLGEILVSDGVIEQDDIEQCAQDFAKPAIQEDWRDLN